MTEAQYQRIAELISRIRNAKFGEMVEHLEQLIESGIWRDFKTPVGTHFVFRAKEFDYFLAAQEIDPTVVRYAYLKAEGIEDLSAKQLRLADITGRGKKAPSDERRSAAEVARLYGADPSGAGARIRAWHETNSAVVSDPIRRAAAARNPEQREALESGQATQRRPRHSWRVEWENDRATAEMIATKLLRDPALAREVYKRLHSWSVGNAAKENRRSAPQNSGNGRAHTERVSA